MTAAATDALPTVLITGASTGIGAAYAEAFAKRGHGLVLVARDEARLAALASRLSEAHGVAATWLRADLTDAADLARVAERVRVDPSIGVLVNNAGSSDARAFVDQSPEVVGQLLALNATALLQLTNAAAPRMAQAGQGAIVNVGSVVGFAPEFGATVYGATKAFVLFLSQGLNLELAPKGVYVQAVVPAATRTEIWERSGADLSAFPEMMEPDDLVAAALVGFDRREAVTIPPLHEAQRWEELQAARLALMGDLRQAEPAARYR